MTRKNRTKRNQAATTSLERTIARNLMAKTGLNRAPLTGRNLARKLTRYLKNSNN